MELTEGILKSIESGVFVSRSEGPLYALKYKGVIFNEAGNVRLFANKGSAKSALTKLITNIFRHGEYWQNYKENIKTRTRYEVDFSATISILPSYGETSRFDDPANKKMFKEIGDQLLKEGIFTIEEIK